jgi:hypothetical protein
MREVHRILREMSARLREYAAPITASVSIMGALDWIFAKGRFGVEFDCCVPRFSSGRERRLALRDARHPLLEDVLRQKRMKVVPLSLTLDDACRTLLISGPNTGGKTVTLKTVGLIALMLYLAFYYRLLGIVTWVGMAIWGTFAFALVSLLGHAVGYALTLAGVAGIIVSLGITADSYIVFYERLKDEVRHGKTLRSAVVPAFKRSWRTIVAADTVTITAALVLYLLAVGSVRGFALTLGLSTALDLFVVYFFKRPTVFLISRSPALTSLRGMGLRSGVAADPLPVAGGER